ncbi:MAG: hypothetical protein WDO73_21615 [Ignavibacteriota bacterium]
MISSLVLIVCLAGCQHGGANNTEAVRQGVIDHLVKANYNVSGMDIQVASVKFDGEKADATVSVTAKGQTGTPPMTLPYHLERQNGKWVVLNPAKGGHGIGADPNAGETNPHGGAMPPAAPGADNPHGGMPPAGGAMPSPHDLPPATKK